jgi:hypothetical protein
MTPRAGAGRMSILCMVDLARGRSVRAGSYAADDPAA